MTNISIEEIVRNIKIEYKNPKVFDMLIKAYNRVQEDECDGVDYLFNLDNKDDLICCIKGGLTAKDIFNLYNTIGTQYFFFGYNHKVLRPILKIELDVQIYSFIETIVEYMFAYPYISEYKDLYTYFVTNKLIN